MHSQIFFLLILVGSPGILYALHIVLSRATAAMRIKIPSLMVAIAATFAGFIFVLALAWSVHLRYLDNPTQVVLGVLYALITYGCFSHAYMHLFFMGETARRLHVLNEIKKSGRLTPDEIALRYSAHDMLMVRLERLLASGQLRLKGDRYILHKKFLCLVSRILLAWGRLIGFRAEFLL